MAPGLNGRQTGTVPKKKSKCNGSQSFRQARDTCSQLSSLDWEPMSDLGNKKLSYNKSSNHSDAEGDSVHSDVGRSRSSTMTSQNENEEEFSQNNMPAKMKLNDRKQVVSKLSQIQSYLQQTADLMNAIKSSDAPSNESGDSRRMQKFTRIVTENFGPIMCTSNGGNHSETVEEELSRRSEESRRKLECLQKRKQDLLKLQDKAKKQLQEAQAEQSRLVARASSLNQELSSSKMMDLNVEQLNKRLKAVQQMYNTRNQINDSLNDSRKTNEEDNGEHVDDEQLQEMSDQKTEYQLVTDKMEELNAMKAQLGEIQKMMASINGMPNGDISQRSRESNDDSKDRASLNHQYSLCPEGGDPPGNEPNSVIKLEQAKSKLNHLTQLLDIVQTAQNTNNLPSPYLQMVNDIVNEGAGSLCSSPSPPGSVTSPQKKKDDISLETMQVMTRELEETTAAMKEERDKLEAARQELQNMAKRLPLSKSRGETLSPNDDSESEVPCLKSASLESSFRDILNMSGSVDVDQTAKGNDSGVSGGVSSGPYLAKRLSFRNLRQQPNSTWNASSNSSMNERQSKNESLSRSSNISSRNGSRNLVREPRWSPAPSVTYCSERTNPLVQTQNQLEMSSNLCEMALSESGLRSGDISLQAMFNQHQLLTRTVAQCSQLLWLQQKQIIELRNAIMLQNGGFANFNPQQMYPIQGQPNIPNIGSTPQMGFSQGGLLLPNVNPYLPINIQPQQNYPNGNIKINTQGSMQSMPIPDSDQMVHPQLQQQPQQSQNPTTYSMPDHLDYDPRLENFNRLNLPITNQNQNVNLVSGSNSVSGRVPNALNCPGPEEAAGALNNQVPPGNRANNYWDNFRSYSRQNLLSNSKSNEGMETSRRTFSSTVLERPPRDQAVSLQNNQSVVALSQQQLQHQQLVTGVNAGSSSNDQFLLTPSQNSHSQVLRGRSSDSQNHHRNQVKNESRHQENDSRILSSANKNEGAVGGIGISCSSGSGARSRHSDGGSENIRSVRNDVGSGVRTDNINSSRNFNQSSREHDNGDVAQGINKKRLDRSRGRKEGLGNLNNRGYYNSSLWENISSEVSSFIRSNEARPHFLIQLFRDLQQVTTDNLRQRTLESIQETVTANNLMERQPSNPPLGGNVNVIENRNNNSNNHNSNNVRENRSNLNRNQMDDPTQIDELFCQLRENQNTIRQNIGMSSFVLGGNNLENPNISNIRDLVNPRNNLENEGLRDLRTYFEANLCNFGGHHSTLENPNLSNIRENLTRRPPATSDYENVNPKNVYLSIYDNAAVETRRRNLEQAADLDPFRNFVVGIGYPGPQYLESVRPSNNQFELGSFEEGVEARGHYPQENGPSNPVRFPIMDGGDNFGNSRQYLPNVNDSGIDINFNNEERKRSFAEGEVTGNDVSVKPKKNEGDSTVGSSCLVLPQWQRISSGRESSFESSSFMSICDNSFFNCRSFQQLDNGDLAEADQSRNDETSGAESEGGYILPQMTEPENGYVPSQSHQSSESNFSGQNVPESERNFPSDYRAAGVDVDGASGIDEAAGFPNPASEPEGNFPRINDSSENLKKSETPEGFYYQLNATSSSESGTSKSGTKYRKRSEDTEKETAEVKKSVKMSGCSKSLENAFKKFSGGNEDYENENAAAAVMISHPSISIGDNQQRTESRESLYSEFSLDKNARPEKGNTSPEAESDWECESGLDQVPTRLKKSGSSRKSDDSGGSIF